MKPKEIKIMNYNILNGFCNDFPPFKMDSKRMNDAIEVIKEQNPDILILTEAFFWPFAKKINMNNLDSTFKELYNDNTSLAYNSFRWAPVVLSKYPVTGFNTSMSKFQMNYMRALIQINDKPFTIDLFHPHPDTTEKQKTEFLNSRLKNKNSRYLLAGDFNALSPEDNHNKQKLIKGYESFMGSKAQSKVEDMLRKLSIGTVLNHNLIDTYKAKTKNISDFTIPTNMRSKNKDSAIRIDYIFCSKDMGVIDSGIIKNKLTEKASDHYPITSVLEIGDKK